MNLLYLLDPSIIKESSTKVELIKTLLALKYGDYNIDQLNINLLLLKQQQHKITEDHYQRVYYLTSENFLLILNHLTAGEQYPLEVSATIDDFKAQASEGATEINEDLLKLILKLLKPSGRLFVQNENLNLMGILNGFVTEEAEWIKPSLSAIPLKRLGANKTIKLPTIKKLVSPTMKNLDKKFQDKMKFFDTSASSSSTLSEDELIDENDLLEEHLSMPVKLDSMKCVFDENGAPMKRRKRACKDCTCGLKEFEEQEMEAQNNKLKNAVKFNEEDITEIDFTVEGEKLGGCGSCALGDAFRCDGCPYLGLPPFKPGEAISIGDMGDDL